MEDKKFTASQFKKAGFTRDEELDFHDDGNNFKGYNYKGLPMTYLTKYGEYYISFRFDYLGPEYRLGYYEYSNFKSYRLANEFNGTTKVDLEKLVANAEIILAEINEWMKKPQAERNYIEQIGRMNREQLLDEFAYLNKGYENEDKIELVKKRILDRMTR